MTTAVTHTIAAQQFNNMLATLNIQDETVKLFFVVPPEKCAGFSEQKYKYKDDVKHNYLFNTDILEKQ